MKKWVAALTALAVAVAAGVLVIRRRAQVQREQDRVDALKVATTFLSTPVAGHGGLVRSPAGTTEAYADIIGQGRVEASPLLLASMSAAVAPGTWRMPHLVTAATPGNTLAPAVASGLRRLMAGVVTFGTAAKAGLPSGTAGKTGTAQYGDGSHTHAWFTGYRGDLAFCVYVKDGASGGSVAAPLAARFLRLTGV